METHGRSLHPHVKESEVKIGEEEVTIMGLAVGVMFAWRRRNVVSLDSSEMLVNSSEAFEDSFEQEIPPMYCRSFGREEGRREEIQSRTCVSEVNCEREEPLMYRPSLASPSSPPLLDSSAKLRDPSVE